MTEAARLDDVARAPLAGRRAMVTGGSPGGGAPRVRRGEGGRIISIGSTLADRAPIGNISVYALTKAAVAGLSRNLARELGPRGITVNTVQPGPVETDLNPASGEFADAVRALTAVGHYAQPHDISAVVAFL